MTIHYVCRRFTTRAAGRKTKKVIIGGGFLLIEKFLGCKSFQQDTYEQTAITNQLLSDFEIFLE